MFRVRVGSRRSRPFVQKNIHQAADLGSQLACVELARCCQQLDSRAVQLGDRVAVARDPAVGVDDANFDGAGNVNGPDHVLIVSGLNPIADLLQILATEIDTGQRLEQPQQRIGCDVLCKALSSQVNDPSLVVDSTTAGPENLLIENSSQPYLSYQVKI